MTYKGNVIKINTVKEGGDAGLYVWIIPMTGDESAETFKTSADAYEDAKQFVDDNLETE